MKERLIVISTLIILFVMMISYVYNTYNLKLIDSIINIIIVLLIFGLYIFVRIPIVFISFILVYIYNPIIAIMISLLAIVCSINLNSNLRLIYYSQDDISKVNYLINYNEKKLLRLFFIPGSPKNLFIYLLSSKVSISKRLMVSILSQLPLMILGIYLVYLFNREDYITMVTVIIGWLLISYIGLNYFRSIKGDRNE